jgi:hypothetical protein
MNVVAMLTLFSINYTDKYPRYAFEALGLPLICLMFPELLTKEY